MRKTFQLMTEQLTTGFSSLRTGNSSVADVDFGAHHHLANLAYTTVLSKNLKVPLLSAVTRAHVIYLTHLHSVSERQEENNSKKTRG